MPAATNPSFASRNSEVQLSAPGVTHDAPVPKVLVPAAALFCQSTAGIFLPPAKTKGAPRFPARAPVSEGSLTSQISITDGGVAAAGQKRLRLVKKGPNL